MQRGFVRYIQRGDKCVDEPAGLMGAVIHSSFLLVYHVVAVALYIMWLLLCQYLSWQFPLAILECGLVFAKAVKVILPLLLSELWA
jgi:squalene monooxygenase